jgi:imidazolonepropionase-like amidohydrolase
VFVVKSPLAAAVRILVAICGLTAILRGAEPPNPRLAFFFEELEIQRLIERLTKTHRPASIAFVGVRVVPMSSPGVLEDRTVLVRDGRIEAVEPSGSVRVPSGYLRVEGRGRFLAPGLTDMHVHTLESDSHYLLDLVNGVTTVREMCGFPWMLALRERVRGNHVLAPNLSVAGHILNAQRMDYYATVVRTPEEARRVVGEQVRAGYEFIKVHNALPREVYVAIGDEAARRKVRMVGHVPHDITVADAIRAGQWTLEHFKGYILDATLELASEDYVTATRGADVWNCPTFYNYRGKLRGEEARKILRENEEFRYVSSRDRRAWLALADRPIEPIQRRVFDLSRKIFRDLLPVGARFLAGTDSGGGAPYMVRGYSLLEELSIMEGLGLSPYETLRTATVNAAQALDRGREFGTVEPGRRADLLLLEANPLDGVRNLRRPSGVMVHGIWLDGKALASIRAGIEKIYSTMGRDSSIETPSAAQIDFLLSGMRDLAKKGWIFKDHQLEELAEILRKRGRADDAASLEALRTRGPER